MLNLSFKTEYIIGAVVIVAFLLACFVREYVHEKQIERMQKTIDALNEQAEIQQARLSEADARITAKDAELLAVNRLCLDMDEAEIEIIQTKEAINEKIQLDKNCAAWADENVPYSIRRALYDIMRNTKTDHRD